jgi:hypothetical protein
MRWNAITPINMGINPDARTSRHMEPIDEAWGWYERI